MAINELQAPPEVSLSESPVFYQFKSTSYILEEGQVHQSVLTFGHDPAEDEIVNFVFLGELISLTFKAAPNTSGTQLLKGLIGLPAFWTQLANSLQENFDLNEQFIFEAQAAKVSVVGRNLKDMDLEVSGSSDPNIAINEDGTDPETQINYYGNMNLYVATGTDVNDDLIFKKISNIAVSPDESAEMVIDLSSYLRGFLEGEQPQKEVNLPYIVTDLNKLEGIYFVEITEFYGIIPGAQSKVLKTDQLRFIKGGWNHADYPNFKDLINDFIIRGNGLSRFMTFRPLIREVTEAQPEWLYFYNGFESKTFFKVVVTVTYEDATEDTRTDAIIYDVPLRKFLIIPAGVEQLGLNDWIDPSKTLFRYKVFLVDNNEVPNTVTDKIQYDIVEEDHLDRFLIYQSSAAAWETLRIFGRTSNGLKVDFDTFKSVLGVDYTSESRQINRRLNRYNEPFNASTGFKTKEELEFLVDFLRSEEIILIEGNNRIPMVIDSASYDLVTDDNYLYAFNFSLMPAYDQTNYSAVR